ncbi:MAG TPA: hypothetical protein ENK65_00065 [Helicobacteraceae bacterium]|nr:hypothetical protein [Helicobacteraceae bacterium]
MSQNTTPPTENTQEDHDLYSDIDESQTVCEQYLGLSCRRFIFYVAIVLGMGIYLGSLLFGTSSLEVMMGLDEYENYLQSEVERYKNENAQLQKEYFELKELDADTTE